MNPGSVPEISGSDTGFVNATRTKTATVNPRNGGGGRENGGAFGRLAHPELVGVLGRTGDGRRRPESSGRAPAVVCGELDGELDCGLPNSIPSVGW